MIKFILVFFIGLLEQTMYTLYLISVNHYLIGLSTILMFSYMVLYLGLISKIAKDKDSIKLILIYAGACGLGNWIAMTLKIIK
jgi:hypothetical protein